MRASCILNGLDIFAYNSNQFCTNLFFLPRHLEMFGIHPVNVKVAFLKKFKHSSKALFHMFWCLGNGLKSQQNYNNAMKFDSIGQTSSMQQAEEEKQKKYFSLNIFFLLENSALANVHFRCQVHTGLIHFCFKFCCAYLIGHMLLYLIQGAPT